MHSDKVPAKRMESKQILSSSFAREFIIPFAPVTDDKHLLVNNDEGIMSYASVAAHNAPPISEQPHADQALLQTEKPAARVGIADDTLTLNIVGPDFKENPTTITSEIEPLTEQPYPPSSGNTPGSQKPHRGKNAKDRASREIHKAEAEATHLWALAKEQILRPGVAGGLIGVVNVGIISWAGYSLYTRPALQRDTKVLGLGGASLLALFGLEGFAAQRYAQTPNGQKEAQKAKEEGSALYRHSKEVVLRPGVLGGLVGLVNVGVLGTVGFFAWREWDRPTWDRRFVSAVSVGILTLLGGEGLIAEKYRESH